MFKLDQEYIENVSSEVRHHYKELIRIMSDQLEQIVIDNDLPKEAVLSPETSILATLFLQSVMACRVDGRLLIGPNEIGIATQIFLSNYLGIPVQLQAQESLDMTTPPLPPLDKHKMI